MSDKILSVKNFFTLRIVHISIFSGVLFYIVANPYLFKTVENIIRFVFKKVGVNVSLKGEKLLLFHAVVFATLMGLTTHYIFTPLISEVQKRINAAGILIEGLPRHLPAEYQDTLEGLNEEELNEEELNEDELNEEELKE